MITQTNTTKTIRAVLNKYSHELPELDIQPAVFYQYSASPQKKNLIINMELSSIKALTVKRYNFTSVYHKKLTLYMSNQ